MNIPLLLSALPAPGPALDQVAASAADAAHGVAGGVAGGVAEGLAQHAAHPARLLAYGLFLLFVLAMLALDLGVFNRKSHTIKAKEAIGWTVVWISVALAFNVGVYFLYTHHVLDLGIDVPLLGKPGETTTVGGMEAAQTFFAAYILEKSLSLDNLFVMTVIFGALKIPSQYQHRVLFWGILGALIMRGVMIAAGAALVHKFAWMTYVFGGFLVFTALKMALHKDGDHDPDKSLVMRAVRRVVPVHPRVEGQTFLTRVPGHLAATPLLVALVMVEVTDLVFAVDSIPAVFAVTADPFIVFTSNIMAILGLRALYFCLATMIATFKYLKPALVLVLGFVGVKMCLVHTPLKVPLNVSMAVIIGVLAVGIIASLVTSRLGHAAPTDADADDKTDPDPDSAPDADAAKSHDGRAAPAPDATAPRPSHAHAAP